MWYVLATEHFAFFLFYVKIALKLILSLRKLIKIKTVVCVENKQTEDKGRREKWTKGNLKQQRLRLRTLYCLCGVVGIDILG